MSKAALLISLIIPPLGLPFGLLGIFIDRKNWRTYIFILALFMSILAYNYEPYNHTDLIRYFDFMRAIKSLPISQALISGIYGETGLYGFTFISWMISKTGDFNLLQMVSTFVTYYIAFRITMIVGENFKVKNFHLLLYVLFILTSISFYSVVNNVRNVFAFSIISYAVFRDTYLRKKNVFTFLLYIIPVTLHSSAILLIIIRLFLPLIKKNKLAFISIGLLSSLILSALFPLVFRWPTNNFIILQLRTMVIKGYYYFTDTSSEWGIIAQNSGSILLQKLLYLVISLIFVSLIFFISNKKIHEEQITQFMHKEKPIELYNTFVFSLVILSIASVPMITPSYWRFAATFIVAGAPAYFSFTKVIKIMKKKSKLQLLYVIAHMTFFVGFLAMLLWMREMRFDNIQRIVFDPFISSPIIIILKLLL